MKTDYDKLMSDIRAELLLIETAVGQGGEVGLALQVLKAHCGHWQRRAHEIQHPPQPLTESQADTAARNWRQFTNDQRVVDFCQRQKLTLSRERLWYWCKNQVNKDGTPRWGSIVGLEKGTEGIARITDGVQVWIERRDGSLFLGHQEWFKGQDYGVAPIRKQSAASVIKKAREMGVDCDGEQLRAKVLAMLMA